MVALGRSARASRSLAQSKGEPMARAFLVFLALWFAFSAAAIPVLFDQDVRSGDFPRWIVVAASIAGLVVSAGLLLVAKGA